MELTFECPSCRRPVRSEGIERADRATCPACGHALPIRPEAVDQEGLRHCARCGTGELYIQKDFPQGLGLAIVLVGFAISTVFWYLRMPLWTYAILMASALLDLFLYSRVPDVTICYRCLSQHRGARSNPGGRFAPFDLAIGERFRQERLRVEELRSRASADGGTASAADS